MKLNQMANRFFERRFAPTPHWPILQKIRYFFITFIVTCAALAIVKLVPNVFPGEKNMWNQSLGYWVLAFVFLGLIRWFGVQGNGYIRLPALDWRTGVAALVAIALTWGRVDISDFTRRSLGSAITSLAFILSIGLGEEFVSRGYTYGMFARFGDKYAIIGSSLIFGIMHISWYLGKYWDPWAAYWHISNAAAFGVFACGLMIATRSIWPGIVMHGLHNWPLAFNPDSLDLPVAGHVTHSEFWAGLFTPVPYVLSYVLPGLQLFYLGRSRVPNFLKVFAVRWKLVEEHGTGG